MMKRKNTWKRLTAAALALCVTFSCLPASALAAEAMAEDEAIRQTLLNSVDGEEYPQGVFDFLTPRMETSEDVGEAEFAIVRRGSTDEAASVTFKAIDMTAKYGEDYILEVPGLLFDRELPHDPEARTLSEERVYEVETDTGVLAGEAENDTTVPTGEAEADMTVEPVFTAGEQGMDLRGARTALTGAQADPTTWREADSEETAMLSQAYGEMYDELPGVEYVLDFAPGEYIKTLKFVTIDDDISEDEEQVLFVLSHPVNGAVSENPTGFMNIQDNEEPEEITFVFVEDVVTVAGDSFQAVVTVERKTGLHRYGTVVISSAEGTAAEGEYYDGFATELAFVPGQEYQKIEIPIKKHPSLEDVSFQVRIDETDETALVTIQGALTGETAENQNDMALASTDGGIQLMSSGIQPLAVNDGLWCRTGTVSPAVSGGNAEHGDWWGDYSWRYIAIKSYNQDSTVKMNLDLSMVGKIGVTSQEFYEGTWFDNTWWLFGRHGKKGYYNDMQNYIKIGNSTKVTHDKKYNTTDTITLNDSDRKAGSITFGTKVWGSCREAMGLFKKEIKLYYLPIEIKIGMYDDDAMIQRRIYTSPNQYTNNGNAFLAGKLKFQGERADITSKFFYNDDVVSFEGTNQALPDDIYLWGIKFETKAGSTNQFFYYKGDSFSIRDLYTGKLKDVNGKTIGSTAQLSDSINGETFPCYRIYPVYRQKTAYTTIKIDESKSMFATGTFKNEETVKTGVLDQLQISIAGKGDYAVSGFNYGRGNRYAQRVTTPQTERALSSEKLSDAHKVYQAWSPIYNKNSDWVKTVANADASTPGSYLFSPRKTDNSLEALYQKPEISVAVNPRANSKEAQSQGFVAYVDEKGNGQAAKYTGADANGLLRGDEIKVSPYRAGTTYQFIGGFHDPEETGYKFQWQDFTGDIDRDGQLSYEEIKALGNAYGSINKGVYAGDMFNYVPNVMGSPIVYFNIVPKAQKDTGFQNSLSGNVLLSSCSVIENSKPKPTVNTRPIANATVTAGGHTVTTDAEGRWRIEAGDFDAGEIYTATLAYGGRSYTGDATVNRAAVDFIVDEYNTFNVKNFNAFRVTNDSEYENVPDWNLHALSNSAISNEDKRHLYTFEIDELLPTTATVSKVEVERHSSDGTLKKVYTAVYNEESGVYEVKDPVLLEQYKNDPDTYNYSFDPATEAVAAGDYLTVRVFDQYDVGYIKHDIGFTYKPKLSVVNIVNSFKSPVNNVIDFIGDVDMAFDLGLTAKMDALDNKLANTVENKLNVSTSEDERTISYGWNKDFKKSYDSSKKDDKKDPAASPAPGESPAPQTAAEKVKEEAKKLEEASDQPDDQKTPAQKEADDKLKNEAADTAKNAVDQDGKDNKKTSKVTADLKVNLSVALELVMGYDKTANRYYFKDFVVTGVVSGKGGATYEYTTPIGIVIFVKGELAGDITAMLAIEPYYQNPAEPNYLYMDEAGTIDLTKLGNADVNRQLSIYGKLMIRPRVTLTVRASLLSDKLASVGLTGAADFDMIFTTAGDGAGNVTLNAHLELTILGGLVSKKWRIAEKKYDMFSLNSGSLARLLAADGDYRYDAITPEDTDPKLYLSNRGGWNENGGISLLSTGTDRYNEQVLQTGAYPHAYPQIFVLNEGSAYDGLDSTQLLLFLDQDSEKVCLMYSIYGVDERGWSQPSPIDANTAGDDTPQVEDLGDQLFITWSSQSADTADDPVSRLNSRDIKAVFFNKATRTFSDVQYVTKTTQADNTADDYASASYYEGADGARKLLVTYIKTQYQQTGNELTVGDLTDAYSTIAYRFYDFATGQWVEDYSEQANQALLAAMSAEDAAVFTKNWYGQGFVDLSNYVSVDESKIVIPKDDPTLGGYAGLWFREPTSGEISLATLSNDPKVMEHETINCGKYAVSAYLVDLDGGNGTIHDRDIFLQLYDFETERFYPAIRLTNDAHNQSYLELADTPDGVKLYYISNGSIAQRNISRILDNMLQTTAADGTEVLVLNKYYPVYSGEETILSAPVDTPYTEFIVNSDDSHVYLTWTESGTGVREGIDRHSDAATEPENYFAERHLYMAMETYEETEYVYTDDSGSPLTYPAVDESGAAVDYAAISDVNGEMGKVQAGDPIVKKLYASKWTKPVQMTDEQGANFSDIDCVMIGNGVLRCVYLKGMSKVTDISGEKMPAEDVNDRSLVSADFDFNVERYTVSIDNAQEVTAGREAMPVQVTVKNESLLAMSDVHLALSALKSGETALIDDTVLPELGGGESATTTLTWDVPAELDGVSLVAAVEQGGLDYGSVTESFQSDSLIEITDISHEMLDRNTARFAVYARNTGSENAKAQRVYANCNGVEFASEEFDLPSGAETVVTLDISLPEETFTESRTDTTITETAAVKVYTDGSIEDYAIVRTGDAALEALMNSSLGLVDGDGNSYTDSIRLAAGDLLMLTSDSADAANAPRLNLSSDNEAVVSVTNGVIKAEKAGTAKLKVELYPAMDVYMTGDGERMRAVDTYYTLPSCLIQTRELTAQVSGGGTVHSTGSSTTTYPPVIEQPEHGKLAVSPSRPEKGDKVTVTVTPEDRYELDTLTVTDRNGKSVEVTKNADGTYTFTQPTGKVTISAVMKAAESACPKDSTCPIHAFTDASAAAWYHDGVHYCIEHGLMNGYGNNKFAPGDTLTRGMLAQILYNQAGQPAVSGNSPFEDVAPDAWYAKAVAWAAAEGVVKGYGDGRFGPTDPITREQLAAMLWRYAQSPSNSGTLDAFTDADAAGGWAVPALQWAVEQGILTGKGDGILDPTGNATRAEAATMLQRFCEKRKK